MTTVLVFIGVLAGLIFVHELGHFLTAKAYGIKILEFGFGYPPRLLSWRRGETVYSLNLLPLGGFVKLLGEKDPTDPRSLARRDVFTRFVVLSSGALMNVVLPVLIFTVLFAIPERTVAGQVVLQGVAPDSPAERAGLKPGDIVQKIDGHPVGNTLELAYRIRLKLGAETEWEVLRQKPRIQGGFRAGGDPFLTPPPPPAESQTFKVRLVPRWRPPEGQGHAGVLIGTVNARPVVRRYPVWEALPRGAVRTWETLVLFKNEIAGWIIGTGRPQLAGPIAIAQATGEVARAGWQPVLEFTALLSLNLAILNVLPIPMLDGGRLLFLAIEWVRRGKRIPPEREGLVHFVGFMVLMALAVVISYFDILRILRGESLLP